MHMAGTSAYLNNSCFESVSYTREQFIFVLTPPMIACILRLLKPEKRSQMLLLLKVLCCHTLF